MSLYLRGIKFNKSYNKPVTSITEKTSNDSHSVFSPADQIMSLQGSLGNRSLRSVFQSGTVQPKLKINQPGDKYEKEADRVADLVVNQDFNQAKEISLNRGGIQRKCSSCASGGGTCEGCEEEIHRKEKSTYLVHMAGRARTILL